MKMSSDQVQYYPASPSFSPFFNFSNRNHSQRTKQNTVEKMALFEEPLTDEQLQRLYTWIDEIPLSRPKRNISRDFSDGVLLAEVVRHYFPRLVEIHNYPSANSTQQKVYNWNTLNSKVLRKLGYNLSKQELEAVVQCTPNAIEHVLNKVQVKMAKYRAKIANRSETPERGPSSARSVRSASPSIGRRASSPISVRSRPEERPPSRVLGEQWNRGNSQPAARVDPPRKAERERDENDSAQGAIIREKDQQIDEYKQTIEILELKITKLEQLVRLKDSKIAKLQSAFANKDLA
jgi:hypothetical protein